METNKSYTDNELFSLISDGNESAFTELFNRYLPLVQPVVLQIVKTAYSTEDVVQDVFMRLWLYRDKLMAIEDPRSYIFRMVYNRAFDNLNQSLKQQKANASIADNAPIILVETPEDNLQLSELKQLINIGIEALPPQAKRIYTMSRQEGLTPAEISVQLDLSIQTVRNSLTRSAKTLREHLQEKGIMLPLILLLFYLK